MPISPSTLPVARKLFDDEEEYFHPDCSFPDCKEPDNGSLGYCICQKQLCATHFSDHPCLPLRNPSFELIEALKASSQRTQEILKRYIQQIGNGRDLARIPENLERDLQTNLEIQRSTEERERILNLNKENQQRRH